MGYWSVLPSTNSPPSRPVRSVTACRAVSHSRGGRCARLITLAFVASERHAAVTHGDLDLTQPHALMSTARTRVGLIVTTTRRSPGLSIVRTSVPYFAPTRSANV